LGPATHVVIRIKQTKKDVASLTLSHGDMLYIPDAAALAEIYEVSREVREYGYAAD
jgi:ribosomal protein L16 Arg81 hydroxylase